MVHCDTNLRDVTDLPGYRVMPAVVYGTFVGIAHMQRNVQLPMQSFRPEHRDFLRTLELTRGIAHYESLLANRDESYSVPVPADLVLEYRDSIIERMFWVEGWRPLTIGQVSEMLDQVRNRVLSFALDLEKENPAAGDSSPDSAPTVAPERVSHILQTNIYGGTNVVASGAHNVIQDFEQGSAGDWGALSAALRSLDLPDDDIEKLRLALEADSTGEEDAVVGPSTQAWLRDVSARIQTGALKLANGAAGSVVGTLLLQHAGLA